MTKKTFANSTLYNTPNQNKIKKHTALTIPVWSPTTVLGKPNPAWLRSSDGIRYIQGGMTVWCRYNFFIVLIPYSNFFAFTFLPAVSIFIELTFSTATTNSSDYHFWVWPIFITKLFLSPPWFFFTPPLHQLFQLSLPNYFDFFSLLSLRVQRNIV